jgi:CRISPR-associated protein Cas1
MPLVHYRAHADNKAELAIPVAFRCTAAGEQRLESRVRHLCRDALREQRVLPRIVGDLDTLFGAATTAEARDAEDFDRFDAKPGELWDEEDGGVAGGVNYADEEE